MGKDWATQHLAEFLAVVSSYPDEQSAIEGALAWTSEALEAEVVAVVARGRVRASLGYRSGEAPVARLASAAAARGGCVPVPPGVECPTLVVALDRGQADARLVVARVTEPEFSTEEVLLVRTLARILTLALGMINLLAEAR